MAMTSKEQALFDAADNLQKAFFEVTGSEDAFNYNRLGEVMAAIQLGFNWNQQFSGADAFDSEGNPIELKSTTQATIRGTYNGLSCYDLYDDFEAYLRKKYPSGTRHVFTRKVGGRIVEAYEMENEEVLKLLLEKTRNRFWDEKGYWHYKGKDQRVGTSISASIIKAKGTKIL
jgi:hypothetical protein